MTGMTEEPGITSFSKRKTRLISIFKWVSVDVPVKVKEVSPSNIETADHVGKYKVELGITKKK
jgi:hypothetical protein